MARRRSAIADFLQGYAAGKQMRQDYDNKQTNDELSAVESAKPEDLGAKIASGPEADGGGDVRQISFLGKTYNQPLTDDQISGARAAARVGVLRKRGRHGEANALEESQRRTARENERFGMEKSRFAREEDAAARDKAYRDGMPEFFKTTRRYQAGQDHATQMAEYDASLKNYNARIAAGESPQAVGMPPRKPEAPTMTPLDSTHDMAQFLAYKAQHGQYNPQEWMALADRTDKLKREGALDALKLLQSGDSDGAVKAFDAAGDVRIVPGSKFEMRPAVAKIRGADVPTHELIIRRPDGSSMRINAAQQLDALDGADKLVQSHWTQRQDARADKQLDASMENNRLQRQDRLDAKKERDAARDAGVALFSERNPGATPAQIRAVQTGVLSPTKGEGGTPKFDAGDVATMLGTPAVDEQGRPISDPLTGRQVVNRNPQEEAKFVAWMQERGIADTNKALPMYMAERAKQVQDGGVKDESDAHKQAAAAISQGADKAAVNARLKKLGFRELP